jgi:uncharacterized protein (DUF362 family)
LYSQRKPPARGPVALVRITESVEAAVRRSLELSGGLESLPAGGRVLVKPNLVGLPTKFPVPPFGVVTTTAVMEAVVKVLREAGVKDLAVGDGGLVNEEAGTHTLATMELLGLPELAKRYGLELLDLNEGPFQEVELEGLELKLSRAALEADFVISLPVLKTHGQCKVSLALKNMKGCLHTRSKVACHASDLSLDRNVALMAKALYPDLALIDGRYALARGPLHFGTAQRADLVIAARDSLDADLAGTAVIGLPPEEIGHLADAAELLGRNLEAPATVGGLSPAEARLDLPWDFPWADHWTPAPFVKAGVRGVFMPKYDASLCTGCSFLYNPALVMLMAAGQGKDLGGVEYLTGKATEPSGRAATSVLAGNCIIKALKGDPRLGRVVRVAGCPPKLGDLEKALQEAGVPAELAAFQGFAAGLAKRYPPEQGFDRADYRPAEGA